MLYAQPNSFLCGEQRISSLPNFVFQFFLFNYFSFHYKVVIKNVNSCQFSITFVVSHTLSLLVWFSFGTTK